MNLQNWMADATRRAYQRSWDAFMASPHAHRVPVPPARVAAYLSEEGERVSHSTMRLMAAAIGAAHRCEGLETPCQDVAVVSVLAEHARQVGRTQRQATGIDAAAYDAILQAAPTPRRTRGGRLETQAQAIDRATFDLALIGVMRDAMLRRSEASALIWTDMTYIRSDGSARLTIRRSKTDQAGEGAVQYLNPDLVCLLGALQRTRPVRGGKARMFPLSPSQICRRIQAACAQAGLTGNFSGHSPRVGMAQDLAEFGASMTEMMTAGRWKSDRMPALYTRNQAAGRSAVAKFYTHRPQ